MMDRCPFELPPPPPPPPPSPPPPSSPPLTPPGYTKYFLKGKEFPLIKPIHNEDDDEDEDEDEDELIIFSQSSTKGGGRGDNFFSIKKKRMNGFYRTGVLILIVICILMVGILWGLEGYNKNSSDNETTKWTAQSKHSSTNSLTLLSSILNQAWTKSTLNQTSPESSINKIKRLPQCIIIGARKCGTRALIDMLNLHPQVEKAALEVHFFDRDDNYRQGLEWYRAHMPDTREDQLSLEKSPSYFVTPEVPERIHDMNSSIKLLLIVREPVTRVISDYTQIYGINSKAHNGSGSPRLEDLVLNSDGSVNVHYKAIRISMYGRYLQRWLDVFPIEQFHLIDGDALIRDPYPVLKEVERFLGLQPQLSRDNFYFNVTKGFYCWRKIDNTSSSIPPPTPTPPTPPTPQTPHKVPPPHHNHHQLNSTGLHCLNDSKGRRHPQVDMRIVSKLRKFYAPHNLRFYDMISRDFGWPET